MQTYSRVPGFMGAYGASLNFQTVAGPTANSIYGSLRWTSTTALFLLRKASLRMAQPTTSSAGIPTFGLFVGRTFTTSHGGGVAPTISGNALKKKTSYPTTQIANGDLRYGSTSALTGGVVTLDVEPFLSGVASTGASFEAADGLLVEFVDPIVLATDEGLVLSNLVAQTLGVTKGVLYLEWVEVDAVVAQASGLV